MPAASGKYDYYASGVELRYMNEAGEVSAIDAVSHGAGSMNAEGTFTAEKTDDMNSSEFAEVINENLYDISRALGDTETEFRLWKLSDDGKLTLSDEVFIYSEQQISSADLQARCPSISTTREHSSSLQRILIFPTRSGLP